MRLAPLAVLLLVVPLFAQRYDDSITVNVVEVPVYVERFGRPIEGLTRDDFELFVDGAPRPIEYFDVLEEQGGDRPAVAAPTPAPELKRRRLVVLLFDVGSSARALHRSRAEAVQFVERSRPGDTYAVAVIGRSGLRFLVPFTSDRVAVQRAIGTLTPSGAADPFRVATLDGERAFWQQTVGGSEGGAGALFDALGEPRGGFESSRSAAAARDLYRMDNRAEQEERLAGDRRFMSDLSGLADRLKSLEGVKHVVLLSERPGIQDVPRYFNPAMRLHERYRAAGVILDAVDIRQPWAPGATAAQAGSGVGGRPDLFPSRFLHNLALDTGGAVVSSLRHLEERNRITYVLGFRLSHTQKGTSSIRVRVKDAPLLTDVRYRRSFTVGAAEEDGDDTLFLADALLNDIPQRGLTVDLDVEGGWVVARIPGAEMLAHPSDKPLPLDVFFYVFDAKGEAIAWSHVQVRVDLAAGRPFLDTHPYTIRQEFRLEPGRYVAKALVRVAGTDTTGFRRAEFVVTAP